MLGIAIIGAGKIGEKRAREVGRCSETRLVVVVDTDDGRARALALRHGCEASRDWEKAIARSNVDAVIVATTHNWLAPIGLAALECRKHVLCEKPLAMNAAQAQELVEAAERYERKLKTGFNHRYHPAVRKAYSMAQAGAIGRLLYIRCRYGHGGRAGYAREWRADPSQSGGGELWDQGAHALDLFRWFLGDIHQVHAVLTTAFWPMPVEDNAFCTLTTASGQVASLHTSWTQWKNLFSFEVFGDEGYLIVEGLGGSYGVEKLVVGRRPPQFGPPEETISEFDGEDGSWAEEWKEFIGSIRENRKPLGDGYDGWQVLKLIEAASRSSKLQQVVTL